MTDKDLKEPKKRVNISTFSGPFSTMEEIKKERASYDGATLKIMKYHDKTKVSTDIIRFILSLKPNVNIKDWLDYTPLNYALENEDTEIIKLLEEHGNDRALTYTLY